MAAFIASQRARYGIPHATACRALGLSSAWFYKWQHGDASPRHARRQQLTVKIKQLFAAHRGVDVDRLVQAKARYDPTNLLHLKTQHPDSDLRPRP